MLKLRKNELKLNFADAAGMTGELSLLKNTGTVEKYDLPPVPPKGIYDLRWNSDRMVEKRGDGAKELVINSAFYPVTLTVTGGNVRIKI